MKNLVISNYGTFVGIKNGMLFVKDDEVSKYYPLNRLNSVSIAKRGVTISSNVIESFSARGIDLFFLNFRGTAHAVLVGNARHGVANTKKQQYKFCSGNTLPLAKKILSAKIKNQRAVLKYFYKYHRKEELQIAAGNLDRYIISLNNSKEINELVGFEGISARIYFDALKDTNLFSSTFFNREKRGSVEINNSLLNLGYAVLSSYILKAIENAGLEPYVGIIHAERPGKMSLVLDLMEEYRAWVVDRTVIKLRYQSEKISQITPKIKKNLISNIQKTCSKKYPYRKKQVKLEHIIQRQVYRLNGHFNNQKTYRPYLFRW